MNIADWLLRQGRVAPRAPAVYLGEASLLDYGELSRRTLGLSRALVSRGLGAGDRVAVWMANNPSYLEVLFAIWTVGAVAVPLNFKLHPQEVREICLSCEAVLLFVDGKVDRALDFIAQIVVSDPAYEQLVQGEPLSCLVERNDRDLAWLFYTSGTAGRPKGAMLSFGNLRAMAHAYLADVDREASDKAMLYAAPMSHGAGMYSLPQTLIGGAHVIPTSGGFDPKEILLLAGGGKLPALSFFAAPTMVKRLVAAVQSGQRGYEGIGLIVYGGGPMKAADLEDALAAVGNRFAQIYGQGEAPMTITHLARRVVNDRSHPRWQQRLASVGIPHSCVDLKIAPSGEVLVSGPMVMLGYWNDEEATSKTLVNGWLHTGDVGFMDEDGFLHLTDRFKDLIISGGSNIYPREVEEVLLRHPGVEQVSVVGVPDPDWGEIVVAFIVSCARSPQDEAALDRHCIDHMARFKRPRAYIFLDDLPKNAYGKVLKSRLKESYRAAAAS